MALSVYINGRFLVQPQSGVQRFATEMTAALHARRPELTLLLPPGAAEIPQALARVPLRRVGRLSGQAWEQLDLPRHTADGVLINLGNTAPLRLRRQVLVVHDCGVFSTKQAYSWRFRAWYRLMQGCLVRAGIPIVTVSAFSRDEICRHLRTRPAQVSVIAEGGEHMRRIAAEPDVLQRTGLQAQRYVLVVGNLAAHKNLAALGELAQTLHARGMTLAITGGLDAAVFRSTASASLPQPAQYLGRVSDGALRTLFAHAACFVFPSQYEGFGLPVLEAMACDCPVVAADIPPLREICGLAAQFCDPTRPDDIAAAVAQVLDTPGRAAALRQAGAARLGLFTWDKAAAGLLAALQAGTAAWTGQSEESFACASR